jgi:hypothetical protein
MDEGHYIRVKDDEVSFETKYKEPRRTYYGYSTATVSTAYDNSRTETELASSNKCCECDEAIGTKLMSNVYETDEKEITWKVWVCRECGKNAQTWADLTWRNTMPHHITTVTKYKKVAAMKDFSDDDKIEDKELQSFLSTASCTVIPEQYEEVFEDTDCEGCGAFTVYGVDAAGSPVCQDCFELFVDIPKQKTAKKCNECLTYSTDIETSAEHNYTICRDCMELEDAVEVCETCRKPNLVTEIRYRNNKAICNSCSETPTPDELDDPGIDTLELLVEVTETWIHDATHELEDTDWAVQEIARKYSLQKGLLTWILYLSLDREDTQLDEVRERLLAEVQAARIDVHITKRKALL